MDYRRWVRDASKVHAALQVAPDGSVVTKRKVAIYIPERYVEKQLASIAADIYTLGIFAVVVDDQYYAVSNAIAKMRIKPTVVSTVKFDGVNYLEFGFDPGSVVIADTELVKDDFLVYQVFDEFVSKGKIPWFIDYRRDLGSLFEGAGYYAGLNLSNNHVILDIIAAAITRVAADPTVYYRHRVKNLADLERVEPVNIPLRSVSLGATNTTSKLVGSYFGEGLNSALVHPSDKVEKIESILRM